LNELKTVVKSHHIRQQLNKVKHLSNAGYGKIRKRKKRVIKQRFDDKKFVCGAPSA